VSKSNAHKSILMASVGALALALPVSVQAQNAPAAASDGTVVVVTGQKAALKSARSLKRNADQIVDSIQATDIGKLPDVNTIESLQRISGVQIQRRYGEGGTDYDHRTTPAVTIRGMTQVRNLIDGHDYFTADGGRAPDLEGLPSELMAGVDVYKNPAANLIEGGIGGIIDIRTRMPFDSRADINSVTVKANYYDRDRKSTPAISALFSRQFDTGAGRMGLLFNLSLGKTVYRQDAVLQQQQHVITAASDPASFNSFPDKGSLSTLYVPTSFEMYQDQGDRTRVGGALAYQWQVNDNMLFTAQLLHSQYEFYRRGSYFYGHDKGDDPMAAPGSTFTWDGNGNALTGTLDPQAFASSRFDQDVRNNTTNLNMNLKWKISDRLRSKTDFQHEDATYDADRNGDSIALYPFENTGITSPTSTWHQLYLNFNVKGKFPTFSITDPSNPNQPYAFLGNPNNWYYEWLANAIDRDHLRLTSFTQEFDYDMDGFFKKLHGGIRASDTKVLLRGNWDNTGVCVGQGQNTSWSSCQLWPVANNTSLASVGPASNFMKSGVGLPVVVFPEYPNPASSVYQRTQALYSELFAGTAKPYSFRRDFQPGDINQQGETTLAAYLSGEFGTKVLGLPLDGVAGLRAVQTRSTSTGYLQQNNTTAPVDLHKTYTDLLPSLNMRLHVTDELQIRAAYSYTLTRPNFSDMAAHVQLNPDIPSQLDSFGRPTGSSGNPYLNPMTAHSYDLSAEYYWGSANLAYVGLFKKLVKGYEASGIQQMTFNNVVYDIGTNTNLGKGTIQGLETGYTQFFDFLPGLWSGLGVQANYTYVDSKVQTGANTFMPLPKLSKNSYNIIGLYEKGPVQARLAYNWRSSYLDQLNGSGVFGFNQYAAPYSSLDGSFSYQIDNRFTVSVDAVNLTNSVYHTYIQSPDHGLLWQLNDRRYSISLKTTF
jgi:TonB-dependent receptor